MLLYGGAIICPRIQRETNCGNGFALFKWKAKSLRNFFYRLTSKTIENGFRKRWQSLVTERQLTFSKVIVAFERKSLYLWLGLFRLG